jgi:hypothetical protein
MSQQPEQQPEEEDATKQRRFKGPGQWRSQAEAVQQPHDEPEDPGEQWIPEAKQD